MLPGDSSIANGAMERAAAFVLRLEAMLAMTPAKVTMAGPCHATPKYQAANMLQPMLAATLMRMAGAARSTRWRSVLAAPSGPPLAIAAAANEPKRTCGADKATMTRKRG